MLKSEMEKFHDTCEDTRTIKQISWEEGQRKVGGLRYVWENNFGKSDYYKVGKRLVSILILILLWSSCSILIENYQVRLIFHITSVLLVNLASVWFYRQTLDNKRLTKLNVIYIICCGVITIAFYKYMDFIFNILGRSAFLSFYYWIYYITGFFSILVRIWFSIGVVYIGVRECSKGYILNTILAIITVVFGVVYKSILYASEDMYYFSIFLVIVFLVLGMIFYLKNNNKFTRNVILAFSILAFVEILGSHSVYTGDMESYIKNGMW